MALTNLGCELWFVRQGAVTGHQRFGRSKIRLKAMSRPDRGATRQSGPRNVRFMGSSVTSVVDSDTRHGLLVFEN
jgi:hypothetical protein